MRASFGFEVCLPEREGLSGERGPSAARWENVGEGPSDGYRACPKYWRNLYKSKVSIELQVAFHLKEPGPSLRNVHGLTKAYDCGSRVVGSKTARRLEGRKVEKNYKCPRVVYRELVIAGERRPERWVVRRAIRGWAERGSGFVPRTSCPTGIGEGAAAWRIRAAPLFLPSGCRGETARTASPRTWPPGGDPRVLRRADCIVSCETSLSVRGTFVE